MTAAAGPVELPASAASGRRWTGPPIVAPGLAVVGVALLVLAGTVPIWGTTLQAPQYPKGLSLWFYGGRAEGPVREVNTLNHYIGMQPVDLSIVPELGLWPLAIVGAAAMFLWAVLIPGRLGRLGTLGLLALPVGILADIQRWLMIFGSELDPDSALQLDPFVPLVVGPSTIWNFTVWTYPGLGLVLIWVVGLVAILARRSTPPPVPVRLGLAVAGLIIAIAGTIALVIPAVTPDEPATTGGGPPAGPVDLARLVEAAPAGATIVVPAGSYRVHLVIDRPLTLIADGDVYLDGGGRGSIVTITADDVTVRGFHLTGTGGQGEEAAAIKTVEASRVTIEGNRLHRFFTGIAVNGGEAVWIVDNVLEGSGQVAIDAGHAAGATDHAASADPGQSAGGGQSASGTPTDAANPHAGHGTGDGPGAQGDGISIWTTVGVLIRGNTILDARDAIYLNYADEALVDSNVVERSRYAVHSMFGRSVVVFGNTIRANLSGLVFMYTHDVLAGRNALTDARSTSTGYGVVVKDVVGLRLAENLIARNRVGIQAEGTEHRLATEALIVRNRIAANDIGAALMATADLAFAANDFDGNLTQVLALEPGVEAHNDWANGGTGNTWSDYAGFDLAGDGVGDIPYTTGGAGEILLARDPALTAYRTSPALAVLDVARAVWESAREPVVRDAFPRIQPTFQAGGAGSGPVADAGTGEHAGHGASGTIPIGAASADGGTALGGDLVVVAWRAAGAALLLLVVAASVRLRRSAAPIPARGRAVA